MSQVPGDTVLDAATNRDGAVFLGSVPPAHERLMQTLATWVAQGWLRELDRSFALFLARQAPDAHGLLILAAALASHQLGRGHACLDLAATAQDARLALSLPPEGRDAADELPEILPGALLARLDIAAWPRHIHHASLVGGGDDSTPLVLEGSRLYLRRYWRHEQVVRLAIARRVESAGAGALADADRQLARALAALFPAVAPLPEGAGVDWQKIACALATRQRLSVITGGPGTGKTTTVVKLLAVLQSLALAGAPRRPLRIRLAAPTGKAAARLNASIARAVENLPLDGLDNAAAVRAAIPKQVGTVHRLLGSRPDTRHFRHHAGNRLALDVLVVDEASMLDLEMASALFEALPEHATLVLLGDKDQLASVEAGALLGDLCQRADAGHYTPATAQWLAAVAGQTVPEAFIDADGLPVDQAIVKLRISHRFARDSGIGQLADAVNAGSTTTLRQVLRAGHPDLARVSIDQADAWRQLVVDGGAAGTADAGGQGKLFGAGDTQARYGYRHYLQTLRDHHPPTHADQAEFDAWAARVLAAHGSFQLLCALRAGAQGVVGLNAGIEAALADAGLIPRTTQAWYLGRPVLVTRNDYSLGLMNGDVGVTLALPGADASGQFKWAPRVAFASDDGSGRIRWILPSRLRSVETVYAMTVHKSQGSEFDHAALLLPERLSPVLTRELIYTGITRARQRFTLVASMGVLQEAIERRVERTGGLAEGLFTR